MCNLEFFKQWAACSYNETCPHFLTILDVTNSLSVPDNKERVFEELLCNWAFQNKTFPQDSTVIDSFCDTQIVPYCRYRLISFHINGFVFSWHTHTHTSKHMWSYQAHKPIPVSTYPSNISCFSPWKHWQSVSKHWLLVSA